MAAEATLAFDANIALAALRGSATSAAALMCPRFQWVTTEDIAKELHHHGVEVHAQQIRVSHVEPDIIQAGSAIRTDVRVRAKKASHADLTLLQLARNLDGLGGIVSRDSDFEAMHAQSLIPACVRLWRPRAFYKAHQLFNWNYHEEHQVPVSPLPGFARGGPLTVDSTRLSEADAHLARYKR